MNSGIRAIGMICVILAGGRMALADADATAFAYPGRLIVDGKPADGAYDLRFWLDDAGGRPVAGPLVFDAADGNPGPVTVSEGEYVVELDFGLEFDGNEGLRLRVEGRPHKTGDYVELSVQPLAAVPVVVDEDVSEFTGLPTPFVTTFVPLDLGVGTNAAEGPLHVIEGSAGSVTAHPDSIAVFERGSQGFLSILTPDDTARGIAFGDPSNPVNGSILYNTSAIQDGFEFRAGGNQPRMVLTSAGDVGIGTTFPLFDLQVNALSQIGGVQTPATMGLRWATTSIPQTVEWCYLAVGGNAPFGDVHLVRKSGTDFRFSTESVIDAGPTATQLILTGAGNVGIGTPSPTNRLTVVGSANVTGNLGVGTASPSTKLHVLGAITAQGGEVRSLNQNNASAEINLSFLNNVARIRIGGDGPGATNGLDIQRTSNVSLMRILHNGSVGIGTSNPGYKLDVNGAIRPQGGIFFPGAFDPSGVSPFPLRGNFLSFGDPGFSEDVLRYGNNRFIFQDTPGGGDTEDPLILAGDFDTLSDIRFKKDIRKIESGLEKVLRLEGIEYRFDGRKVDPHATRYDDGPKHLGFSAQAVAEIVPEVVHYYEDIDRYAISYGAMVPVLVEAIKEQQAIIDSLVARIEALESEKPAQGR